MRDVTFDTSKRYSVHDEEIEVTEAEIEAYEVPEIELDEPINYNMPLGQATGVNPAFKTSVDEPGDTIIVDSDYYTQNHQLLTPERSPEPRTQHTSRFEPRIQELKDNREDAPSHSSNSLPPQESEPDQLSQSKPRSKNRQYLDLKAPAPKDIIGDVEDQRLVLKGKRTRT
jgi:hypothetical protein